MRVVLSVIFVALSVLFTFQPVAAQVIGPDDDYLFSEDSEKEQERLKKQRENLLKSEGGRSNQVDFSAPQVDFDQNENVISGKGGVIVSGQDYRIQGREGSVDLDTKDVSVQGDVLISGPDSNISAESAEFNLDTEVGEFKDSSFTLEEGAYTIEASEARKLNDLDFELENCLLSTCHCPDGSTPWQLDGSTVNLEREAYAHVYNAKFRMWDVPILYTPWIAFPVKEDRSSGLLVPEIGYSSRDGMLLRLPTYLVLGDSSDATVTPFTETKTRHGLQLDYRQAFSERSSFNGRIVYSNETPRDGELRGTDVTDIAEPEIDDDRFGGFIEQSWSNSPSADIPMSLVSDIHWVSDTLFLREMDDPDIGHSSSRYATSRMAGRANLSDYVTTSVVGEWNEAITSPQDLTFQRLPEFNMTGLKSYRPFGFNPYGLKITPQLKLDAVNFARDEGYDGVRYNVNPSVKVPFHYKNYFNSEMVLEYNQTQYELDEVVDPDNGTELDDSNDRGLFRFSYEMGTAAERIYDLPSENILTTLTSLGTRNQTHSLERVKHTIEPKVSFSYVPGTNQDDLPVFDSFDRIRKKSLITYEVITRLIGSFGYQQGATGDFEEFTSATDSFTALDTLAPLSDFDIGSTLGPDAFGTPTKSTSRRGGRQIRDIMSLRLVQSYDYEQDQNDTDPERNAFSDLGAEFKFMPTGDFALALGSNVNVEDPDVNSWSFAAHLNDDRGDRIRTKYSYVEDGYSNIEGNLEVPISSRLRLGYYARFDEEESEFVEQQAALRISSKCDCWHVDIGFSDQINPDKEQVLFRFTLKGLGDLTQGFGVNEDEENNT